MSIKQEQICRICFSTGEDEFEVIEEITKEMFDVLLLKMDLDVSENPSICQNCACVVKKLYYFKTTCINTDKFTLCSAGDNTKVKLELKDACKHDTESDNVATCGLCRQRIEIHQFVSVDFLINNAKFAEMFTVIMPEIELDSIRHSVICTPCEENLKCYFTFIQNYSITEEKIKSYLVEGNKNTTPTKLCNLLEFSYKVSSKQTYECTRIPVTKQETDKFEEMIHVEAYGGQIKTEPVDIKDEDVTLDINSCESPLVLLSSKAIVYSCRECTYKTINKRSLTNHVRIHTLNTTKYKNRLTIHMLTHKDPSEIEMYKCLLCTYETKYKSNLKAHMLTHKNASEVQMHKCTICTFETKHKKSLKGHMSIHKSGSEVKTYKCPKCTDGDQMVTNNAPNEWGSLDTIYNCPLCQATSQVHKYKCKLCLFVTKYKKRLKAHMVSHKDASELEMYKCATCMYETKYKGNLFKHTLTHKMPSETQMYKCKICSFQSKYGRSLKSHMLIHRDVSEVQTYKCRKCTFETKDKRGLKSHALLHKDTLEMTMHKCPICAFRAKYWHGLKAHMVKHENPSTVKMHKCTECTYQSKRKSGLKTHLLVHEDVSQVKMYKCQLCAYESIQKWNIKKHMIVHKDISEVQMYKCPSCPLQTKYKKNLKNHMLVHKRASEVAAGE